MTSPSSPPPPPPSSWATCWQRSVPRVLRAVRAVLGRGQAGWKALAGRVCLPHAHTHSLAHPVNQASTSTLLSGFPAHCRAGLQGTLHDHDVLVKRLRHMLGDLTFMEAFQHTGGWVGGCCCWVSCVWCVVCVVRQACKPLSGCPPAWRFGRRLPTPPGAALPFAATSRSPGCTSSPPSPPLLLQGVCSTCLSRRQTQTSPPACSITSPRPTSSSGAQWPAAAPSRACSSRRSCWRATPRGTSSSELYCCIELLLCTAGVLLLLLGHLVK